MHGLMESSEARSDDGNIGAQGLSCESLFEEDGIILLPDWPARSTDLNSIENPWNYLEIQVSKHNIPNLQELWTIVEPEFFKIPDSSIEKLFDSIRRRIDAVIKNKGHPIRY